MIGKYIIQDYGFYPYDDDIPAVFELVKDQIIATDSSLLVEPIGSTSVPGMGGKNIINVLIPCESKDFDRVLKTLEGLGFQESPIHKHEPAHRPMRVGSIKYRDKTFNIHLHLTETDSWDHKNAVFLREYLKDHPEAIEEYAKIKKEAVKNHASDPEAYHRAKNGFIKSILKRR